MLSFLKLYSTNFLLGNKLRYIEEDTSSTHCCLNFTSVSDKSLDSLVEAHIVHVTMVTKCCCINIGYTVNKLQFVTAFISRWI